MSHFILGLTGSNAAGKGTVSKYLVSQGYDYISLSDELRQEAFEQKLEASRENLTKLGKELRSVLGPGFLAKRLLQKITVQKNTVVDSIRHPKEVEILATLPSFHLLGVDADVELRFERALRRGRNESAKTLEEFKAQEAKENQSAQNSQQLQKTLALSHHVFLNNKTPEDLIAQVQQYLDTLS
ncbi:MAG: AAA family ATPase [Bdellovibrionales bacterium]|nr:AAA family ATPase [Bdellovibrionales bacterium]